VAVPCTMCRAMVNPLFISSFISTYVSLVSM
jgi:hypothetical protein